MNKFDHDHTKTYASKKGLVAAIKKTGGDLKNYIITQQPDNRWAAEYVTPDEDVVEPVKVPTFDLTENELHAAMLIVLDCISGMGGKRPSDLRNDEYTWAYAEILVANGWSKEEAAGTFSSLDAKGVIYEYDKNEMVLATDAWEYLDTLWDDYVWPAKKAKAAKPNKPTTAKKTAPAPVAKVTMPEQNGIRRPKPATLCGQAWALFDAFYAGNPAFTSKEAIERGVEGGLNKGNLTTELSRWRKFNGINAK